MPAYLSIMAIAVPHVLGGTYVVEVYSLIPESELCPMRV